MNEIKNLWRDAGDFAQAYIDTAFWSSTDDNGKPLDKSYNWTHLAPDSLQIMLSDCKEFQTANEKFLENYPDKRAGHDFWLTRNGHGAGFWENDFGDEADCEALGASSRAFGTCDLYVGDDGMVHVY